MLSTVVSLDEQVELVQPLYQRRPMDSDGPALKEFLCGASTANLLGTGVPHWLSRGPLLDICSGKDD